MEEENFYEVENEEWIAQRNYYRHRLNNLKREQDELAIEVIHYNNHRKFALVCRCIEITLIIIGIIISFLLIRTGMVMNVFCGGLFFFAVVIPFTVHSFFGWKASVKEEAERKKSIERLKALQEEIEDIEFKVIDI